MRGTEWGWRRANVVGDKGGARGHQCSFLVGTSLNFEARLNPMQDWAQHAEGGEGSVNVESNDQIAVS